MRSKGFTLIELLVVIAIIAILAAILFPVFARAREKARQTSCLSNVKQLMLGYVMYAQDYDGYFPSDWRPGSLGGGWGDHYSWRAMIYPYVKNLGIYTCPSDPVRAYAGNLAGKCLPYEGGVRGGYGSNCAHWTGGPPDGLNRGTHEADYSEPAQLIVLGDTTQGHQMSVRSNALNWVRPDQAARRHNGGANYSFADGHAKWHKPTGIPDRVDENWWSMTNRGDTVP